MKSITSKLSSKNQITIPKTVRDFIGVAENDSVEFHFKQDEVQIRKAEPLYLCPFCRGDEAGTGKSMFYGEVCEVCNGGGFMPELTIEELTTKLYDVLLKKGTVLTLDTTEDFYRIQVVTDNERIKRYREHFQMEFIKVVLKKRKIRELLNTELKEQLLDYLEFDTSKSSFSAWWSSLINGYTK